MVKPLVNKYYLIDKPIPALNVKKGDILIYLYYFNDIHTLGVLGTKIKITGSLDFIKSLTPIDTELLKLIYE